jgi:hypothetical protein
VSDIEKNGGLAFPAHPGVVPYPYLYGMTLRDWFAGQAMAAVMLMMEREDGWSTIDLASDCYEVADAMLVERAKERSEP